MGIEEKRKCKICECLFMAKQGWARFRCHACHLAKRRAWHKINGDKVRAQARWGYAHGRKAYYAKYEKTPKGFLMRMYRNMQSRILGIQKKKAHLYKGKFLLDRQTFYKWANRSMLFWKLYYEWKKQKYDRKLTPTVDRVNPQLGYDLKNMEWVTHSENSRRSSVTRKQVKI